MTKLNVDGKKRFCPMVGLDGGFFSESDHLTIRKVTLDYDGNGSQLKNPDISGTPYSVGPTHLEFSISILKLNVKMASEMSGFFN